jgi:hypothetical protein
MRAVTLAGEAVTIEHAEAEAPVVRTLSWRRSRALRRQWAAERSLPRSFVLLCVTVFVAIFRLYIEQYFRAD